MGEKDSGRAEWLKCKQSCAYFIHNYCFIYDATLSTWIPFRLWPKQLEVLQLLVQHRLLSILKARQLGQTWLVLCYILWKMLFHPSFTALVFSRRETEAIYLLGNERLRGIYNRLPAWAKVRQLVIDSTHVWQLSNGSVVYGFPTTAGDSYTAGFAFVDEADLVPDLDRLMNAVKPTIDGGGQMVLLSRADKTTPNSPFKRTYRGAVLGTNGWKSVFLPWYSRPERTQEWYEAQKADILSRTGGFDDLYQQYPATDEEALRPPELDRRLPYSWLRDCYQEMQPLTDDVEHLPGLKVYALPRRDAEYVIGADPAEGNPNSDDSSAIVIDVDSGEECAVLAGKFEPTVFTEYLVALSKYYNGAEMLPERNNHGHAVIQALVEIHDEPPMNGWDGKAGWMTSTRGKALMYTGVSDTLREGRAIIHDPVTFAQLASIEGTTLKAPEGDNDDNATAFCLGQCAANRYNVGVEYGNSPVANYRG